MSSESNRDSIAVVMPTATVDAWLDQAVNSIIPQLRDSDRLVVVHDGVPPDRSRTWTSHPRVAILHSATRQGVARSLRTAIDFSDSTFVARMDADDIALPMRLQKQRVHLLKNDDVVMVSTRAQKIDHDDQRLGPFGRVSGTRIRHELLRENVIVHSSVMFRRAAYEQAGGYVAEFSMSEDYHLWLTMALSGELSVLDEELMLYRVHPNQATKRVKQTGPHMWAIIRAQKALAQLLGVSAWDAALRRSRWVITQYGMATRIAIVSVRPRRRSVG